MIKRAVVRIVNDQVVVLQDLNGAWGEVDSARLLAAISAVPFNCVRSYLTIKPATGNVIDLWAVKMGAQALLVERRDDKAKPAAIRPRTVKNGRKA